MKALPNIISLYPPFFIDSQLALTQVLPPLSAGITKNDPNNSVFWTNIL